jgi:hypothetical protein
MSINDLATKWQEEARSATAPAWMAKDNSSRHVWASIMEHCARELKETIEKESIWGRLRAALTIPKEPFKKGDAVLVKGKIYKVHDGLVLVGFASDDETIGVHCHPTDIRKINGQR